MARNFNKQSLKMLYAVLFLVWIPLTYAYPSPQSSDDMVHNDNYDMIMPDDHEPAESMHFQNFDEFFNAADEGDAMAEMEMADSHNSAVRIRPPQPLSPKEKQLRHNLEVFDVQREKRNQKMLTKGSTRPRKDTHDWDQFDYEMLVKHG
ncbi:hypothetical protein DOY81_005460 [Sarcophaga bullata]|nr:hypothetical protein DOY81_005460 [Sarcophaga bullata]